MAGGAEYPIISHESFTDEARDVVVVGTEPDPTQVTFGHFGRTEWEFTSAEAGGEAGYSLQAVLPPVFDREQQEDVARTLAEAREKIQDIFAE